MNRYTVTLGVAPIRRDFFKGEKTTANRNKIIEKVQSLQDSLNFQYVGIEGINSENLLFDLRDVNAVVEKMHANKVDALFVPHCNFGQEEAVAELAKKLCVPVLLWGARDGKPDGYNFRETDTQCGLFAISKVLRRVGVTFTYIENCAADDPAFLKGFSEFIAALRVIKAFRNMTVGQISVRPRQFMSVISNEGELLEKFSVRVVPVNAVQILDDVKRILDEQPQAVKAIIDDIAASGVDISVPGNDKLQKMAACHLALWQFAQDHNCSALASECWQIFRDTLGISPCFVFGNLTDKGLPVACENDIHGAVSSVLAQAACGGAKPVFLADLTIRHPANDNAELLWHCGPFPKSIRRPGGAAFIDDRCQGNWELEQGELTILRFDGMNGRYRLFADEVRTTDGPLTGGNYVWVETDDWPRWERKFIMGPYIHHVTGMYGKYAGVFREACRYLNGVVYDNSHIPED